MHINEVRPGSYEITGLTAEDVRILGALGDLPVHACQSKDVARVCEALIFEAEDALGETLEAVTYFTSDITV